MFYTLFMKTFDLVADIERIISILDLSVESFANEVGVSRVTIINIINGYESYSKDIIEKIYSYAYENKVDLNRGKELIYTDIAEKRVLLFHGAKGELVGNVDINHSIPPNDFGNAFYTGQSLKQAASWISNKDNGSVYAFFLSDYKDLKIMRFAANSDWLYAVLYYRNAFKDFKPTNKIMNLIKRIEESDLIIAPIADNEMFKTIDAFANGEITDEACIHAISATNLGIQYVFKSNLACSKLKLIERMYLCKKEKEHFLTEKDNLSREGINKSKLSLVEYRRKGKYFDEIFKRNG